MGINLASRTLNTLEKCLRSKLSLAQDIEQVPDCQ